MLILPTCRFSDSSVKKKTTGHVGVQVMRSIFSGWTLTPKFSPTTPVSS